MKNPLFKMKSVIKGTVDTKLIRLRSWSQSRNFLKVGSGAETKISAPHWLKLEKSESILPRNEK
jgi:hypothetical protein